MKKKLKKYNWAIEWRVSKGMECRNIIEWWISYHSSRCSSRVKDSDEDEIISLRSCICVYFMCLFHFSPFPTPTHLLPHLYLISSTCYASVFSSLYVNSSYVLVIISCNNLFFQMEVFITIHQHCTTTVFVVLCFTVTVTSCHFDAIWIMRF